MQLWSKSDVEGPGRMTDEITLSDLAADVGASDGAEKAASAAADAAGDDDTGEFLIELYDRMKDDGILQGIMFGKDALPPEATAAGDVDADALERSSQSGPDVDADVVADALEDVQNTVGDLRISQLVKLTRENPELVDNLLAEHLASDDGADVDDDPAEDLENED